MRKEDNGYVKCKTTGRNTKLNSNTLLGTCMFEMGKTAMLHTGYDGIRITANLLNLWPIKDCCRLRSVVTQVCQLLPMFRWNSLLPSSGIPKRRYIVTSWSGVTPQKARICRVTVAGTSDLVHVITSLLLRSNDSFKHWSFIYRLKSSAKSKNRNHSIQTYLTSHWTLYIYLYDQTRCHANR